MTDFNKRLRKAATSGSEIELKELLRASSCDALAKDKDGWTALMHAAYSGSESCVKLLMPASDAYTTGVNELTASDLARNRSHASIVQFIDAYVLAQSEQSGIDAAACPGSPRGRVAPRI